MNRSSRSNARTGALLAALAAVLLAVVLCPAAAHAADTTDAVAYADINGSRTYYATIEEARTAGYDGATIVMNKDWELTKSFDVEGGKTLTIDMNGHMIVGNNKDSVINVYKSANFTLKSSARPTTLAVGENASVTSGGLVTGGHESTGYGGGIYMDNYTTVTLDNVAVAGNSAERGGGIYAMTGCSIYIHNGATVSNNSANKGGGIYIYGSSTDEKSLVDMDNGSVSNNGAADAGGGIYTCADNTTIYLENDSTISDNEALSGGGIFCSYTYFHIISEDRTGSINNNKATSDNDNRNYGGGGIHVDSVGLQEHFGEISGLTMEGNVTGQAGGAIFIDQPYTHVSYCTISGNSCGTNGGGVFVHDDHCSITSCEIAGNVCNTSGANHGGGGVFVNYKYDLTLDGVCVIKGNTRGVNGSADDLFLNDAVGTHAYILGGVDAGSKVGIRTGMTDDQMIGKNITTYAYGAYFIDLDGYYVSHGADHNGDLWQRHSKQTYQMEVNGQSSGSYNQGDQVSVDGTSAEAGKVFVRWSAENSTGLYPFEDYVSDPTNPKLTFAMPQNDVNLVAEYATAATKITVTVQRPVIGEQPPETATISWGDGKSKVVEAIWLGEDGEEPDWVRDDEQYRLVLTTGSDQAAGLILPDSIDASAVSVVYADDPEAGPFAVQDAHIDSDGNLNVTTGWTDAIEAEPENGGGDDVPAPTQAGETGSGSGTASGVPATGDVTQPLAALVAVVAAGAAIAAGAWAMRRREE